MPKPAPNTEPLKNWTSHRASGIATSCPQPVLMKVRELVAGMPMTACVWRSDLHAATGGSAYYSNWLTVAEFERETFDDRGVEAAIPVFVVALFAEGRQAWPAEIEEQLGREAGVAAPQVQVLSAHLSPEEMESVILERRRVRWKHFHDVSARLIEQHYRALRSRSTSTGTSEPIALLAFADKCAGICREVAAMYPDDVARNAPAAEQSAFTMARRTALAIEDRIKALVARAGALHA